MNSSTRIYKNEQQKTAVELLLSEGIAVKPHDDGRIDVYLKAGDVVWAVTTELGDYYVETVRGFRNESPFKSKVELAPEVLRDE
ncbi:hypothetical protein [Haloferax sp. Atlit-12N]|uniref:hypothetical protein n=1 Tax=Haloferax sp. Atlit-12N TaxID=2077203 RepID=UPI0011E603B0|nr:hypothetical protein [Haloferax sp. Atlit-12N]